MAESKIVPISPIMPVGELPKPPRKPCGANTPITWGELYLMFTEAGHHDIAGVVLDKIMQLDAA